MCEGNRRQKGSPQKGWATFEKQLRFLHALLLFIRIKNGSFFQKIKYYTKQSKIKILQKKVAI